MKAAMQSAKQSIGAYGAASAIFSGVIACAFVTGASIFGDELAALIGDLSCDASPDCAAPVAGVAAPAPNDSAGRLAGELPALDEPPAALPATAMQTTR
jgi:hypothetical protein